MSARGRRLLLFSLLTSDVLGSALGLGLALMLLPPADWPKYARVIAAAIGPWLIIFALLRLYDLDTVLEDSQEYATVATGCTYGIVALLVLDALIGFGGLEVRWLFGGWGWSMLAVGMGRFLMRRVVRAVRRRGHLIAAALIVGADEQGRAIARQLKDEANSGLRVAGFVDDFLPAGTLVEGTLASLGHPSALPQLVLDHHITEVVVVPGAVAWESFQQILERLPQADGPRIRLSPGYYDLLATTPRVAHRNFVPLIIVDSARFTGPDLWLKNILDYGLGAVLALLSLPVCGGIALALLPRGAVFQSEEFLGLGGRRVRAMSFRVAPHSWLARTGIYRLPMIWAVVRGHFSLVGPRPLLPTEADAHRRWLPSLASVKPGVSGPWAVVPVSGLEEEMRATLYYIRNWTVWLDLQILIQTALVSLRRRWGTLA